MDVKRNTNYGFDISYFGASIFSQPQRAALESETQIIAPVDGKIVIIQEVENRILSRQAASSFDFYVPLNVHVTRYPATGKIKLANITLEIFGGLASQIIRIKRENDGVIDHQPMAPYYIGKSLEL